MTNAIKSWRGGIALLCSLAVLGVQQKKPFSVVSTVDATEIAGRPVQLDTQGKLLPWPMADNTGYSYSSHFLTQWTILWDQYNRQRLPYYYCCFDFDRTTFEMLPDPHWANSTAYLRAMLQGFLERLYSYTGDARTLVFLQDFVDYELEHGRTPENYLWAQVPYASANPGAKDYTGWSVHGEDYVEPPIVGADGYAYLRLYEMTGNPKYLRAAIKCADGLRANYHSGDEKRSPWPVRCYARDGRVEGPAMGPYSANVIEPIMLFDELIRLGQGDVAGYGRVRDGAWEWFQKYPVANNVWVGYFEDVAPRMENMNQVIPLEFARYVLLHPEKDVRWREHASALIEWVKSTPKWPKYQVHGATVTTEQGDGVTFCCNDPNQCCDSHTARLASVEALFYSKTGDESYREEAFRSFNWVTYFQGLPGGAHAPFGSQWWFTDEFADAPRRMMDAFWAVPEWAPADESHLLGSSAVVTHIRYEKGAITYSTFDSASTDLLRVNFVPQAVTAQGKILSRRKDLQQEGYVFDEATGVLRIRHDRATDIVVSGNAAKPPLWVTFDDPHLAAGTILSKQYPSGVIDWPTGQWRIGVPQGKFGTFNLALADPGTKSAEFSFASPSEFVGVDAYNSASFEALMVIRAPNLPKLTIRLKPGELRRVRTGWRKACTQVVLDLVNGQGLRLDNLAYSQEDR